MKSVRFAVTLSIHANGLHGNGMRGREEKIREEEVAEGAATLLYPREFKTAFAAVLRDVILSN
jgi:hypothetical protein